MSRNSKATAEQYKIELKVFDRKCVRVIGKDLKHFNEEEALLKDGEELTGPNLERRKVRGAVFDYKIHLEQIIGFPADPVKGANYAEMMLIRPILEKLKNAESGDDILLDAGDFKLLKTRVSEHRYPQISEIIWSFIESIEGSLKVAVVEKKISVDNQGKDHRSEE